MTTLHEEPLKPLPRKHSFDLLMDEAIEEQTEENVNEKSDIHSIQRKKTYGRKSLPISRTLDSLTEFAPKPNTPSSSSSGYGSQAVSTTNLSSDDSVSLKSISVDEALDFDNKMHDQHTVAEIERANRERFPPCEERPLSEENSDGTSNGLDSDTNQNQTESDLIELGSVIKTNLPQGRVVRRKKQAARAHRASFPQARVHSDKSANNLGNKLLNLSLLNDDESLDGSSDVMEDDHDNSFGSRPDLTKIHDVPVPDWLTLGESVRIRPSNSSGIVAYIGETDFSTGTWIGVELDAPKGI
ncbi:unnamed protein product, partial [Callosobruchus maculatus]